MKAAIINRYSALTNLEIRSLPGEMARLSRADDLVSLMTDLEYLEARGALTGSVEVSKQLATAVREVPHHTTGYNILVHLSAVYQRLMHTWRDTSLPLLQQLYADLTEIPELATWLANTRTRYTRRRSWFRCETPSLRCGRNVITCVGHEKLIISLHYSCDGTRVVTSSADHTCRVWDASTAECLLVLYGHEKPVWRALFLNNDLQILSVAYDNTCRLWDARTGRCLRVFTECGTDLKSISCAGSSHQFATVGTGGLVRIWDAKTGRCIRELACATGENPYVLMSANGRHVVVASGNEPCGIYNVESGDKREMLENIPGAFVNGQWSPDGGRVALMHANWQCYVYDTRSGRLLCSIKDEASKIFAVQFEDSGQLLITISGAGTLTAWSVRTGQATLSMDQYTDQCQCADFAPEGKKVAISFFGDHFRIWTIEREPYRKQLVLGREANGYFRRGRFNHNGKRLLLGDVEYRVAETHHGYINTKIKSRRSLVVSWFAGNGAIVRGLTEDGTIEEWDTITGQHKRVIGTVVRVRRRERRFADDSKLMESVSEHVKSDPIKMWSMGVAHRIDTKNDVVSGSVSSDGKLCAVVTRHGRCLVANVETCETKNEIWDRGNMIQEAVLRPDGKELLTLDKGNRCKLWDATTGHMLARISGEKRGYHAMTYSPDGRLLALITICGRCVVLDSCTGCVMATFDHERVHWIGLSPDSTWVLTVGGDHGCKLWNTHTGELLLGAVFDDSAGQAVIHPNGGRVFVACDSDRPIILKIEGMRHMPLRQKVIRRTATHKRVSLFK